MRQTGDGRPARAGVWRRVARGGRWIGVIAAGVLAVALTWPSLFAGIYTDDYYHRWVLTQSPAFAEVRPPRMEMFDFIDGDAVRAQRMKQLGMLPWWVDDSIRGRFWRPVTALTHLADYSLWPRRVEWMHAQSIAWYVLLAVLVAALHRQMMGRTVAAVLAGVMFAIDDAHAIPIAWLASRNAVIAAVFGVLAIMCHVRWRRSGIGARRQVHFALLALVCFIASLLSAEAGLATLGYLLAYEWVLDRVRWMRRIAALLPYLIAIVAWRVVWMWRGYGVDGMDLLYTDPEATPIKFVGNLIVRLPILLFGFSAYPPADVGVVVNSAGRALFAVLGVAITAWSVWMLWPLLRLNRMARYWLAGTLLCAVPLCAAFPSNRMLLFIGIGAFGLAGQFLSMALHPRYWRGLTRRRRLGRFTFVAAVIMMHLVAAPLVLLVTSRWPMGPQEMWQAVQEIPDMTEADAGRDVIVVNHPLAFNMMHTLISRAWDGLPNPRTITVLAPSGSPMVIRRVDERTLELRAADGFFPDPFSRLFYTAERPPPVNEPIDLPAVRVTVLELAADTGPRAVRYEFKTALEAETLHWMCWRSGGYERFTPPAVGKSVELPRGRFPF